MSSTLTAKRKMHNSHELCPEMTLQFPGFCQILLNAERVK